MTERLFRRSLALAATVAMMLAATSEFARTQSLPLRVRLVDSLSGEPLAGVLVSAQDANGARGPVALSTASGITALEVIGTPPWRVLVRRIGYAPFLSGPITRAAGESGPATVRVSAHIVLLPAVRVVERRLCDGRAESPSVEAAPLWDEVTKALEASAVTREYRLVTTDGVAIERLLSLQGRLLREDTVARARSGERPFPAVEPSRLERGYAQGSYLTTLEFYAPDERALLSPGFTRDHCVWHAGETRHEGSESLLGLAFAPRIGITRAEIEGTIWLDSTSKELRRVEFSYVRLDLPQRAANLGGEVRFTRTSSGAWIVSEWRMRLPHWHVSNLERSGLRLDGYTELGGSAAVVGEVAALPASVPRTIGGTAFDSLTARPLAGLRVTIPALGRETITDAAGRFRFDVTGIGPFAVTAAYPGLEDWVPVAMQASADVVGRATAEVVLATPSLTSLWPRLCAGEPVGDAASRGIILGRVRDVLTSAPDSTATVRLSWQAAPSAVPAIHTGVFNPDSTRVTRVDSAGRFVLCGTPRDRHVWLQASTSTRASTPVAFRFSGALVGRRILLASDIAMDFLAADSTPAAPDSSGGASVTGRVTDTDGHPLRAARVTVTGLAGELRSDESGRFARSGVPAGTRVVSVQLVGYAPARRLLDAQHGDSVFIDVSLRRMTTLEAVTIRERERTNVLRSEIGQRVRLGLGLFTDSMALSRLTSTSQALESATMRTVLRAGEWVVQFLTRDGMGWCTPMLYIDDIITTPEQLAPVPKDAIAMIEAYRPGTRAPLRYSGSGSLRYGNNAATCGVVLVWTKSYLGSTPRG